MKVILLLISISIIACTSYKHDINRVYEDKEKVLSVFSNVSVFRDERNKYAFLNTHSNGKQNQYIFSKSQNEYSFERDKVLFNPDKVVNITNKQEFQVYKQQLNEKLKFYLKTMDSLNISDVSSEFIQQGITLKVYMKSKAILVYVADPSSVTNSEWINYLKSMKRFDDHWYYAKQDQ